MAQSISVVIPVAPGDEVWRDLIPTLELGAGSEILLAVGNQAIELNTIRKPSGVDVRPISGGSGRAGQMNAGAEAAENGWLWFLHGDSRILPETLSALAATLTENRDGLFFFDLKFSDGPQALTWNEWAVKWRAGTLKLPFGDQGFLIKRKLFHKLGAYRDDLSYGEDHVFAWKVMQEGFDVLPTGAGLLTSGRKYQRGGWAKVTILHVWLTIKQAAPQFFILWRRRLERALS